jgi:hypothetical protein
VGLDGKIKFAPWVHNIIIIEKKSSWLIACFGKYNGRNIIKTDEDRICLVQEAPTAIIELSKKDFSRVKQTHAEEKIKESINYTLIPVPFLNLDLLGAEPDYPNLSPEEIKLRNRLNRDKEIEEGAKLGTGEK